MLLAVDIGNTTITFGVFRGNRIIERFDILTDDYSLKKLRNRLGSLKLDDTIICSVVPNACKILEKDLKFVLHKPLYTLGKNVTAPIKNLYLKPKQVGQDRLVNAYAGIKFFAPPLIVVDFGTAVTFDVVSSNSAYLGGMILPGLQVSLDALADRTALLPKIKLSKPKELIGTDTCDSMLSGVVHGVAALTDSIIQKLNQKIGGNAKAIGTGGNIQLMQQYCECLDAIDPDLTLKGLACIYAAARKHRCLG